MSARDEVEAMLAARGEAMARGDVAGMMKFYVDQCELITGEMAKMSGRPAVSEFFRSMFAEGTVHAAFVIEDLRVEGSLAVFYARELLTIDLRHVDTLDQYALRHMAVLTCADGSWKIVRSMLSLEGGGVAENTA